jgi:hypothetical protein
MRVLADLRYVCANRSCFLTNTSISHRCYDGVYQRLWGNPISYIPKPVLYSEFSKIVAYLKATERERFVMETQMKYFAQAPRKGPMAPGTAGSNARPNDDTPMNPSDPVIVCHYTHRFFH